MWKSVTVWLSAFLLLAVIRRRAASTLRDPARLLRLCFQRSWGWNTDNFVEPFGLVKPFVLRSFTLSYKGWFAWGAQGWHEFNLYLSSSRNKKGSVLFLYFGIPFHALFYGEYVTLNCAFLVTFCFFPSSSHPFFHCPSLLLVYHIFIFTFPSNLCLCWLCLSSFLILSVTTVIFSSDSPPFIIISPDCNRLQVFLPGWGGHVYGGGLALGRRLALSPPAERPLLREHCQTLRLWIGPGPGIPTHQTYHTQVRCFPLISCLWTFFCSLLYCI